MQTSGVGLVLNGFHFKKVSSMLISYRSASLTSLLEKYKIEKISFVYMATDIGGKEKEYMKTKIKYTNEPLGKLKIVDDFLPPPEYLAFKEDNVKVTITLSKASVEFFKKEAKKQHVQYQKMIRRLLDLYTLHHQKVSNK